MSGLVKAKKYDWKDSNIARIGSDDDRKVKKEAAQTEKAWIGAGQKVGLQIWRIEQFKVVHWDKNQYGSFFQGDSYIILNTYEDKETEKLLYDVHFWIGKESTQDEYGTAAYKTVELDTLLDDVPVQHREVQGHESELFKSYFKSIMYRKGGCDTGFKHVEPEKYKPRLMKISSENTFLIKEVKLAKESVIDGDIYILDKGLEIIQFNTEGATGMEIHKASKEVAKIKNEERHGKANSSVLDKEDKGDFMDLLEAAIETANEDDDDDDDEDENIPNEPGKIYKLSDESGEIEFTLVKEDGDLSRKDLKSNDVFIVHKGQDVHVWVGKNASENEKSNGMGYAQKYLRQLSKSQLNPICVVAEGQKCRSLEMALTA